MILENQIQQCIKLSAAGTTTEKTSTKILSYDMEIVWLQNIYQCSSSHE